MFAFVESLSSGEALIFILFMVGVIGSFLGLVFALFGDANVGFPFFVLGFVFSTTTVFPLMSILDKQDGVRKDESFERAYVAYFAYEDKKFDEDELEMFEGVVFSELFAEMRDGELSDSSTCMYETVVNDLINEADPSEDKLAFKEFLVVDRGQEVLANVWVDETLDDREVRLIEFAGELVGDMVMSETIVKDLSVEGVSSESFRIRGLLEYSNLLAKLRKKYDRFMVEDLGTDGKRVEDSFYRVTE